MGIIMDYLKHRAEIKEDGISAAVYWRRKYNLAINDIEVIKEVMSSDVYNKVLKSLTDPLEIRSLKATVKRQKRLLEAVKEERNELLRKLEAKSRAKKTKV